MNISIHTDRIAQRGNRLRIAAVLLSALLGSITATAQKTVVGPMAPLVENAGQWDSRIHYAAQAGDAAVFAEEGAITIAIRETPRHPAPYSPQALRGHAFTMRFVGSTATPVGEGVLPGYSNYIVGDRSNWRSHVHSYSAIRYRDLYPGIDMEVYVAHGGVKYNLIVHPGADPTAIKIQYFGTGKMETTSKGGLMIHTSLRNVEEEVPYAYQTTGTQTAVECRRRLTADEGTYIATYDVGAYDLRSDLVIDPTLIFSTYTGSTADNWGTTAAYDSHKNTYTAGLVFDIGYPASAGAFDVSYNGNTDIGIFKFDTTGSDRLWATYLGGSSADMPHSMFVNMFDELLIFGTTGSTDFPTTPGAYSTSHNGGTRIDYESSIIHFENGSDIFVARLSEDGTTLEASTYVGGSGNDGLNFRQYYNNNSRTLMQGNDSLYHNYGDGARGEIVTDDLGNVYVGSTTMSSDFPTTPGCISPAWSAAQEGVVFKLDYNLRNLLWSTYMGGNGDDAVYSVDVDSRYNVVVCGGTSSTNFPVTDSTIQTTNAGGSADGFVSKISANGRQLLASSYYGARYYDQLYFVRCGRHDDIFVFGQTEAIGGNLIHNAGYSVYNSGMLLARFTPDLRTRTWSTVFGTPSRINLSPTAFAADICDRVYAAGWGRDFVGHNGIQWNTGGTTGMEISPDAYQSVTDGQDFYIISLDADASNLEYATFFGELHNSTSNPYGGSDHVDGGTSRFDRLATLYQAVCASCGRTQMFPTTAGAWCDSNRSNNCNNGLFRFNVTDDFPVAEFNAPPAGCAPYTIQFNNTGRGDSFRWDFGDGTTSTLATPSHTFASAGIYTVSLVSYMPSGCSSTDTQTHTIMVLGGDHISHQPQIACNEEIQIGLTPTLGATYLWTGTAVSDPTVSNPWVDQTGTYILHTTVPGCSQTDTFHVRAYTLIADVQTAGNTCHDTADGKATITLGTGIVPDSVDISITPYAPIGVPTQSNGHWAIGIDSLSPLTAYHIDASGYGCTYSYSFFIPNSPRPTYTKQTATELCTDSCSGWLRIRYGASGDTLVGNLCEGLHVTTLVDDSGCPFVDSTIVFRNHNLDSLRAYADADSIFIGESVRLHARSNTDNINYQWSPVTDIDHPYERDPLATPSDTLACYTVTATSGTCSATASVCVHCTDVICGAPLFEIPNAFTPNGDGVNDAVCFNTEQIVDFTIAIFNRWGQCVYSSDDPSQCWDGTYNGQPCLPGVYTYTCHIRCFANHTNDFKGDITLLR